MSILSFPYPFFEYHTYAHDCMAPVLLRYRVVDPG